MFDPERDDDRGSRPYYLRLLTVVLITAAGGAALLPSVTAFSVGVDGGKGCLAIADGWHADVRGLNAAEQAAESTGFAGTRPTPEQEQLLNRADAYLTWREGPGQCIPESRHRLIQSGIGLGALTVLCSGVALVRRRRNRRPPDGEAEPDQTATEPVASFA